MQNEQTIIFKSFCGTYITKLEDFKRNDLTSINIEPFSKKCDIYCNKRYGGIIYAAPHVGLK